MTSDNIFPLNIHDQEDDSATADHIQTVTADNSDSSQTSHHLQNKVIILLLYK